MKQKRTAMQFGGDDMGERKNKQSILEYQIPPRVIEALTLVMLLFFCIALFIWNAECAAFMNKGNIVPFLDWLKGEYFLQSCITIVLFWMVAYAVFGNLFTSFCAVEVLTLVCGIANGIVYKIRGHFIAAADLTVIDEAAQVNVNFAEQFEVIWIVLLVLGCIMAALFWKYEQKVGGRKKQIQKRLQFVRGGMGMFAIVAYLLIYALHPTEISLQQINGFRETGTIVWLNQSFFHGSQSSITKEQVEGIYAEFQEVYEETHVVTEADSEDCPNVIVIMNEAFWDVSELENDIEMSENPMEAFNELSKRGKTGRVEVNVYGGGTVASEFEFLTGINARSVRNLADWYGTFFAKEQDSMVRYMESLGYSTMAFHPSDKRAWDRDVAYANMGFDVFYSDVDFKNRDLYNGYLSDRTLTKEIIGRFEEQKEKAPEQPIFVFAVSVQNHVQDLTGMLEGESEEYGIEVSSVSKKLSAERETDLQQYINGLKGSVVALEELIDYFEGYEEDTIIVFFGDHAPEVYGWYYDASRRGDKQQYETPYLIYANYENDFKTYGDINVSNLSTVLIEYLDLPRPKQYYMNAYLLENYPLEQQKDIQGVESDVEERLLDVQKIAYYIYDNFPETENALDFWGIAE